MTRLTGTHRTTVMRLMLRAGARWAVGGAVMSFMGSVVCAVWMMVVTATTLESENTGPPVTPFDRFTALSLAGALLLFVAGVLFLVAFVGINTFRE